MKFHRLPLLAATLALFFLLTRCRNEGGEKQTAEAVPPPLAVPKFERDSAYQYVARQVAFGPRVPNTEGHRQCREWLVAQFKSYGLEVIEQPFSVKAYTGATLNGVNIMGRFNPAAQKRILLAAHWDTRHIADSPLAKTGHTQPIPGADDGGSGVGVLLEIARQLKASPPANLGVDFLLFDAEDHGDDAGTAPTPETWCLGSQYWSKNIVPPGYRPKYGILLDMVGARTARFTKEAVSMKYAPDVMTKVWLIGQRLGYSHHFLDEKAGAVTDDHYFVNSIAGIPMIDIIGKSGDPQTGFGEHWHTQNDDMDVIDPRTLRAVGQTLLEVIYREGVGEF